MTGVRSSRKLEAACRDQIPYLWLTGWQHPDHNTLWRFYKSHRQAMRSLFKRTLRTAVNLELVDLAVQAVDGTKMVANATRDRTYDVERLGGLLERLDKAIGDLEAQNEAGEDASAAHLPDKLADKKVLREQVRQAMDDLASREELKHINLTDKDAHFMKTRQGIVPGYNAQAMVSPIEPDGKSAGMLITAVDVVDVANDHDQLIPMMERAEEATGVKVPMTLADPGTSRRTTWQNASVGARRWRSPRPGNGCSRIHITRIGSRMTNRPTAWRVPRERHSILLASTHIATERRCGCTRLVGASAGYARPSGCVPKPSAVVEWP